MSDDFDCNVNDDYDDKSSLWVTAKVAYRIWAAEAVTVWDVYVRKNN